MAAVSYYNRSTGAPSTPVTIGGPLPPGTPQIYGAPSPFWNPASQLPSPWLTTGAGGGSIPPPSPSSSWTDPATALLESMTMGQIGSLGNFSPSPQELQWLQILQGQLGQGPPSALGWLESLAQQAMKTANQPISSQGLNLLLSAASNMPGPLSDVQRQLYQTQASEGVENLRQAAQTRAVQRAGARGVGLSSGVLAGEQRGIDVAYDQARAQAARDMLLQLLGTDVTRAQAQAGAAASAASAEQGLLGLQQAKQAYAGGLVGNVLGAQQGQRTQQLAIAQLLGQLGQGWRQNQLSQQMQALSLAGLLSELPERRLALGLSALQGTSPNLSSITQQLMNLAGLGQSAQQQAYAQTAGTMNNLALMLALLSGGGQSGGSASSGLLPSTPYSGYAPLPGSPLPSDPWMGALPLPGALLPSTPWGGSAGLPG